MENSSGPVTVAVVGAGIGGLHCAQLLSQMGLSVIVLEAASFIGGRVKSVPNFVNWKWKRCDIGADLIHGQKTMLKKYVDKCGFPCRRLFTWAQGDGRAQKYHIGGGAGMYYLGKSKRLERWDTPDKDIKKVNEILWSLHALEVDPTDRRTLEQYLREENVSEDMISLAEAGYANTLCSSVDRLPLYGVVRLERAWLSDGGGDFRLDDSLKTVIDHMSQGLQIRLEWPVKHIDYSKDQVVLTNDRGEQILVSKVVVAIPLAMLKKETIHFEPPIPSMRREFIQNSNMFSAVKILMEFSKRFWPKELQGMICADCFVPEFFFEVSHKPIGALTPESCVYQEETIASPSSKATESFLCTGFACAKAAEAMSTMSKEQIVSQVIRELNEIFGNLRLCNVLRDTRVACRMDRQHPPDCIECMNPPNPASLFFVDAMVVDWSKNPYIGGGYSSPFFGETEEKRRQWSIPIAEKIYFVGEAFNADSIMTMDAAMETGIAVASSIFKSVSLQAKSKL